MTRKEATSELIYKDESYAIIGACFAVYTEKGCSFPEPVCHECLEIEFELQKIPFFSKPPQTRCNIAAVRLFKHSRPISFVTAKSSSKSKPFLPWPMNIARSS